MRRTILLVSVLALAVAITPPASADEPIPVTCRLPNIAFGWERTGGTYSYWEVVETEGQDASVLWRPESVELPSGVPWLYHHGDLYAQGVGDLYCRGRYYLVGQWQLYPNPPEDVWPPPEGSEMYFWGDVTVWLNHGPLRGSGFHFRYVGQIAYDVERNRAWEAKVTWSEGFGQLEGWEFSKDSEVYQSMFPPWAGEGPDLVLSGYLIPADG